MRLYLSFQKQGLSLRLALDKEGSWGAISSSKRMGSGLVHYFFMQKNLVHESAFSYGLGWNMFTRKWCTDCCIYDMSGEIKYFGKKVRERHYVFSLKWVRELYGWSYVNFRDIFIYLLSTQNLSPNCVHFIFVTNGLFIHKLHNQIGSRINCWKWNFLILCDS